MQTPAGEYVCFYELLSPGSPLFSSLPPLSDGFLNYLRISFSSITLFLPLASPDIPPSLFSPSSTALFVAHNNLLARSLPPSSNASPAGKALAPEGLMRSASGVSCEESKRWIWQHAVAFSWIVDNSANIDSLVNYSLYLHKYFTSFKLHKG